MNGNGSRQMGALWAASPPTHRAGCGCADCQARATELEDEATRFRSRPHRTGAGSRRIVRHVHPAGCRCRACWPRRGVWWDMHPQDMHTAPDPGEEDVRWAQSTLNAALGLRLPPSGRLDAPTRSALRGFQRREGLPVDGLLGPSTVAALRRASEGPEPEAEVWGDAGPTPESLASVPGSENVSRAFKLRVIGIARDLGTDPNFLMAAMSFESRLDPRAVNPSSGATGLIQFMPKTAERLGTTVGALAAMTAEGQLDYVARYFAPYRGRLATLEDVYMAILWPDAIGRGADFVLFRTPSAAYAQNSALDVNRDGSVTVAEATSFVRRRLGGAAPATGTPAGAPPSASPDRGSPDYARWVQRSLNQLLGTRLAVDGLIGSQTRSAVRTFQGQKGLAVDGVVGPVTEAALIAAGAPRPPGAAPRQPTSPPPGTASAAGLARQILGHPGITLATSSSTPNGNPRQNILDTANGQPARSGCYDTSQCGPTVPLSPRMLQALLGLANRGHSFYVTSFAGGRHSRSSDHYRGRAVDIGVWNGTSLGVPGPAHTAARDALIAAGSSPSQTFDAYHDTSDRSHQNHVHAAFP